MAVIVVYGGGFQPFHAGHLSSYLEAKQEFPYADFYVAASNDTKTRPIPFNDKKFLAQQAGVADKFTEVKLPIRPTEILDRYNPNKDVFILVRSERDPVAYTKKDGTPGYYQPYVDIDDCEPMGQHGYIFVTHKKDFKLNGHDVYSGTQVRDMYANADDKGRQQIIQQLYPQSNQQDTIKQMLDKYLGTKAEPIVAPTTGAIKKLKADKLKEHIQRMRPLMSEASAEQKLKLLKLMKVVLKESQQGVAEGSSDMFSKVMGHETSPEAAKQIQQQGFKNTHTGIFFNIGDQNYSGGGYGGTVIMAKVSGPADGILDLDDDDNLPDDLDEFADGEEVADYARNKGYWAWTDGVQFAVLDPRHIQVVQQGVAEDQLDEKWSQKYKSSINCANPQGFSQRAHCAGRNKNEDVEELDEGGDVFMPNIKNTPEYKAGFATGKLPVPYPEGTQQYASYYKGVIDKASPTLAKVGEGEQQKGADYRDPPEDKDPDQYGDDYQAMVARVKKLAGLGPMKTVYDPTKRQYRNMPTAQQPKK